MLACELEAFLICNGNCDETAVVWKFNIYPEKSTVFIVVTPTYHIYPVQELIRECDDIITI